MKDQILILYFILFEIINLIYGQLMVVTSPISNLCASPKPLTVSYMIDYNALSQLLFNDIVFVTPPPKEYEHKDTSGWLYVEVIQQPAPFQNGTWGGYLGWIAESDVTKIEDKPSYTISVTSVIATVYSKNCNNYGCLPQDIEIILSLGTYLQATDYNDGWWTVLIPKKNQTTPSQGFVLETEVSPLFSPQNNKLTQDALRTQIVKTAKLLLGRYYLWGGRSSFLPNLWTNNIIVSGVDCSGLVGLSYKTNGVIIPRDANTQFIVSQNVTSPGALKPGDCFFFATGTPPSIKNIEHVMMYIGNDHLIESCITSTNNGTRIISLQKRFGKSLKDLQWGQPSGKEFLFWGNHLSSFFFLSSEFKQ